MHYHSTTPKQTEDLIKLQAMASVLKEALEGIAKLERGYEKAALAAAIGYASVDTLLEDTRFYAETIFHDGLAQMESMANGTECQCSACLAKQAMARHEKSQETNVFEGFIDTIDFDADSSSASD
jgi:hypothetical protein